MSNWRHRAWEWSDHTPFEQLRTQRTHIIVYAGGYFEIFETLRFVQMVLQLPLTVQAQLYTWLSEHLDPMQKRE